ncbi:Protein prenyltransferase alpha subunit repeat-containing protein 1 [Podila epigama]|nr:Protein prenyltransferase alpha subunit repeat-containing protein 1 [Podila epigama]
MSTEVRLANTPIQQLDPSLTKDILYSRLAHILTSNPIDEIGILPFLPDKNDNHSSSSQSNVPLQYPYIVQEHGTKLGIPIYCWVPVLDASMTELKSAIQSSSHNTNARNLNTSYLEENSSVHVSCWWKDQDRVRKVLEATSCIMILSPDTFMAANARKRLVLEGLIDPHKEIKFLDMVLTFPRNCKSSGAWHHRKWLLCHIFKDYETVPLDPSVVEEQLKTCHAAAERYPKCYYAWTMRHWLVEQLGKHWWKVGIKDDSTSLQDDRLLLPLERELQTMRLHMDRNVSDHSTQQHLQQCMLQLGGRWVVQQVPLKEEAASETVPTINNTAVLQWSRQELTRRCSVVHSLKTFQSPVRKAAEVTLPKKGSYEWVVQLWVVELERIRALIERYPGHESLWYHLRFVYYGLQWLDSEESRIAVSQDMNAREDGYVTAETEQAFVNRITVEQKRQQEQEHIPDNIADALAKQSELAKRYLLFVNQLDSTAPSNHV